MARLQLRFAAEFEASFFGQVVSVEMSQSLHQLIQIQPYTPQIYKSSVLQSTALYHS